MLEVKALVVPFDWKLANRLFRFYTFIPRIRPCKTAMTSRSQLVTRVQRGYVQHPQDKLIRPDGKERKA